MVLFHYCLCTKPSRKGGVDSITNLTPNALSWLSEANTTENVKAAYFSTKERKKENKNQMDVLLTANMFCFSRFHRVDDIVYNA